MRFPLESLKYIKKAVATSNVVLCLLRCHSWCSSIIISDEATRVTKIFNIITTAPVSTTRAVHANELNSLFLPSTWIRLSFKAAFLAQKLSKMKKRRTNPYGINQHFMSDERENQFFSHCDRRHKWFFTLLAPRFIDIDSSEKEKKTKRTSDAF